MLKVVAAGAMMAVNNVESKGFNVLRADNLKRGMEISRLSRAFH